MSLPTAMDHPRATIRQPESLNGGNHGDCGPDRDATFHPISPSPNPTSGEVCLSAPLPGPVSDNLNCSAPLTPGSHDSRPARPGKRRRLTYDSLCPICPSNLPCKTLYARPSSHHATAYNTVTADMTMDPSGAATWPTIANNDRHPASLSFLHLPGEIRNIIYDIAMHWPTSSQLYAPYNRRIDSYYATKRKHSRTDTDTDTVTTGKAAGFPTYSGALQTPTILLLCRQVTYECLPFLRSRRIVIDRLPPWLPGASRPMSVSEFISRRTLQSARNIEIRAPLGQGALGSGWVWNDIVAELLCILAESNSFDSLRMVICIFNSSSASMWDVEAKHLAKIQTCVEGLRTKNPRFWAPGKIEEIYWVGNSSSTV
ncbi:hypothetical protein B0H67DRAFT_219488 [Lasiosphaeris hirsuta]|uniref:Uncharacterized protein n=1 Tax=Lasiosphaeris hirsuta TaxID=260670 RepID=A0AA40AF95_9PEZI|nr:hypothetical protein B0H67DRAFT_219488 [Lasiosphaeris hirsuta]